MLRPTQQLCRRVFTRPSNSSDYIKLSSIIRQLRAQNLQVRQRQFSISRSLLAEPARPPQERGHPVDTAQVATVAATLPADVVDTVPSSESKQRQLRKRRRGVYYAVLFLLLGTTAGTLFRITIAPPALPIPGSDDDAYVQSVIQAKGAALPVVQQLSADPSWTSWDAYAGISTAPDPERTAGISAAQSRITSGPMSGSSGLAFQRVFHNAATGEVVTVVYFGTGLAGWPGVVHGGALATLLDESLGRCAILSFSSRTGVTANLELQYRAPTLTNNFYVLRTRPVDDGSAPRSDRKLWVRGSLETENGKTCVEAKALFVVPKGYNLRPLVEGF